MKRQSKLLRKLVGLPPYWAGEVGNIKVSELRNRFGETWGWGNNPRCSNSYTVKFLPTTYMVVIVDNTNGERVELHLSQTEEGYCNYTDQEGVESSGPIDWRPV